MLTNPTLEKLQELRLAGMQSAYREQLEGTDYQDLTFDERFGFIVDREHTERHNRRLHTRLRNAKLRLSATLEDIDYRAKRGLDKGLMLSLATCDWMRQRHNVIITGPTGSGKTYLACALGHKACRQGFTASPSKRTPLSLNGSRTTLRRYRRNASSRSRLATTSVKDTFSGWPSSIPIWRKNWPIWAWSRGETGL